MQDGVWAWVLGIILHFVIAALCGDRLLPGVRSREMKPTSPWPRKLERLSRFRCGRFAHHKVRRNGYFLLASFGPLDLL
jgi:hypothetical protein